MDNYDYLINNISIGVNNKSNSPISKDRAYELLELAIKKFDLTKGPYWGKGNDCAEGKYFAYVGEFPEYHLALDNKSGTSRLHTITTEEQLKPIK